MDGNKKKINTAKELNKLLIPIGEFTVDDELVVVVIKSKTPAVEAAKKSASAKNIAA